MYNKYALCQMQYDFCTNLFNTKIHLKINKLIFEVSLNMPLKHDT